MFRLTWRASIPLHILESRYPALKMQVIVHTPRMGVDCTAFMGYQVILLTTAERKSLPKVSRSVARETQ
jgi:hypothetical protein